MFSCEICGRQFEKGSQVGGHVYYCRLKQQGIDVRPGDRFDHSKPWLKGLTKETHPSIMKMAETMKIRMKDRWNSYNSNTDNPLLNWRQDDKKNKAANLKLSETLKRLYKEGKRQPPISNKFKRCYFYYNNKKFFLRSSYEFIFALFLAKKNINFNYENITVQYNDRTYRNDFEINGKIYEVKGQLTDECNNQLQAFRSNGYIIRLVTRTTIKEIKKYLNRRGFDIKSLLTKIKEFNKNGKVFEYEYTVGIKNIMNQKVKKQNQRINQRKLKRENKKLIKQINIESKINAILQSKISFSKFGWVSKVAELIGIKHQKVSKWMKKYMLNFYNENCFIREYN